MLALNPLKEMHHYKIAHDLPPKMMPHWIQKTSGYFLELLYLADHVFYFRGVGSKSIVPAAYKEDSKLTAIAGVYYDRDVIRFVCQC